MVRKSLYALVMVLVVALMLGCAAQKPATKFSAVNLSAKVKAGLLEQKVDNFLIILDSSASMAHRHGNLCKLTMAKDFVGQMNQTIPDIFIMAGLRKFGQSVLAWNTKSELVYGMTQYSREALAKALAPITWGGTTPLGEAIDAGTGDLKSVRGDTAVIIVTDGLDADGSPVAAAQRMKKAYGDRVCIYPVLVGNDSSGRQLLSKIAAEGGCGFATTVEEIAGPTGIAEFVQKVFFRASAPAVAEAPKPAPPGDSDGDGVIDALDKCPDTPRGVQVGGDGCPFDTDMDGVPDYLDKCPKTPVGAPVNAVGCWEIRPVEFNTNKWDIKPWYYPVLDEIAAVLKKNPWLEVIVEGHTDNQGIQPFNQTLSEKRARAVADYLVKKGLNPEKVTPVGYNFTKPVATNETPEGRTQNRRAQVRFIR